jgi:hypothetical protein
MDAPALDRILETGIGTPESVADTVGLDTSDGTGVTAERMLDIPGVTTETALETALGTIDGMTGTRDASALDRILEGEIGILESVADTRLDTSDGTGVITEAALEIALGTIGTGVGKSEATEGTKLPTPDVATEAILPTLDVTMDTKLDTSETNDERMLGSGGTVVRETSGVEMGSGAVSLTPVPVPATPEVGRSPLGVMIELSVTVGREAGTDERSGTRDETNGITS